MFLQQGTSYSTEQVYPLKYCLILFLYLGYGYKEKVRFELYIPFYAGLLIIQCVQFLGEQYLFFPTEQKENFNYVASKLFI